MNGALLIIDKTDRAPMTSASLDAMTLGTRDIRDDKPFTITNLNEQSRLNEVPPSSRRTACSRLDRRQ
jgi:Ni2+-binding GTPase involved in maturation of urease and hydrogenase